MQNQLPTLNGPSHIWEGTTLPPLKMAPGQEATTYLPDGFVPAEDPTFVPAVADAPVAKTPPPLPKAKRAGQPFLRQLTTLFVFGALCLGAYYAVSRFVLTPVIIQGRSMNPTLRDGEYYLLNRLIYRFQQPERGEVVVLKDPGHNDFAVKRIIAKPGDWLNLKEGKVFLNGERLDESYLPKGTLTITADQQEKWVQLGESQYFVMGDNRAFSEDSRVYGQVSRGNILGPIRN